MKAYKHSKEDQVFVQVTSGRGPAECCWVVAQVVKKLVADCKSLMLDCEVKDRMPGPENGTLFSAVLLITGKDARKKLSDWEGAILWIGKSKFRKFHKRKNWFVGVSFSGVSDEAVFRQSDLAFETFRGSGPGGQHRNKVETAVRVTHLPSGLVAESSVHRSQSQNKKEALSRLEDLFGQRLMEDRRKLAESQWTQHNSLQRGNAVKVFEGPGFTESLKRI